MSRLSRREQILRSIFEGDIAGMTTREVAEHFGATVSYAYSVLKEAVEDFVMDKHGRAFTQEREEGKAPTHSRWGYV